jgi:hypothetical protein
MITMRMCVSFDPRLRDKEREHNDASHDWLVIHPELLVPWT